MSFDFKLMSPHEVAFVKLYTTTLKEEYELFMSAITLMGSKSLGLKCPMQAALVAKELQSLHAEVDSALAALATRHQLRNKKTEIEIPSIDELVRVIQISFFKLVTSKKLNAPPNDKGWFSGHPLDWDKTWKKTQPSLPPSNLENAMTALFNALYQLFQKSSDDVFGLNNTVPGFPFKELPSWDDEEDDEYYENDEDDFDTPY